MDYWERRFVEEGARKMKLEAFQKSLETIKTLKGEQAYKDAILSELPLKSCIVLGPEKINLK